MELDGIGMTSQRTRERLAGQLRREGITNEAVLRAIAEIPRHIFVDEALASRAYENTALPIGSGQTISQPYIVARMTEALLSDGPRAKVLEVGGGSGYQTAILAQVADKVFSVERLSHLVHAARERLHRLRIGNVRIRHGDGYEGWPESGPYDGIMVTAAPARVPLELSGQLDAGGVLVVPVGDEGRQELKVVRRSTHGLEEQVIEQVSFVPLRHGIA